MDFDYSPKVRELKARVETFMAEQVYPERGAKSWRRSREGDRWQPPALIADTQAARARRPGCGTCSCPRASTAPA